MEAKNGDGEICGVLFLGGKRIVIRGDTATTNQNHNDDDSIESSSSSLADKEARFDTLSMKSSSFLVLEDLILYNILGYALDEDSYYALSLVCKEWRRMVLQLAPPAVFQMSLLVSRDKLLVEQDLDLMQEAFEALKDPSSPLYRKKQSSSSSSSAAITATITSWPVLEPRFYATMVQYVYVLCSQRAPHNHSRRLYGMVLHFLSSLTELIALRFSRAMENHQKDPMQKLQQLLQYWTEWEAIVNTVDGLCNFLNRFHVRHYNLEPLAQNAQTCLGMHVIGHVNNSLIVDFMERLEQCVLSRRGQDGLLFLQAYRACQKIGGWSWSFERPTAICNAYFKLEKSCAAALERAKTLEEEARAASNSTAATTDSVNKPVTIITRNGRQVSLPVDSHFIQSSGFLTRLELRGGDCIKLLSVEPNVLDKAIEFYELDKATPCPELPQPFTSLDLSEMVGETFGTYIMEMDRGTLFPLVTFCTLLELEKLLSLATASVALTVHGLGAEEVRAFFHLQE